MVSNLQLRLALCGIGKCHGVCAEGKGLAMTRSGVRQEEDCKGTTDEVSKPIR
jgi:hypothetical protein